jgi:CRP-like cAMP-binding protein
LAEGHGGSEIFIVVSGRLRIEKGGIPLGVIEAGGHVGEMSLIDRNPRSATVNAEEDARLLVLARSSFYALLRSEPALSVKLLWNLLQVISARLRSANRELVEIRSDYEALMSQGVELFHVAEDTGEYVIPGDKK